MHDGGSKYGNSNDMHHLKMGGGGGANGGHHHGAPHTPPVARNEPVKHYSDDCNPRYYHTEQKSGQYSISKGIDD